MAARFQVIPVWIELLADTITPVLAFERLAGEEKEGFLLESVEHAERWGRFSFVGRRPISTLVSQGGRVGMVGARVAEVVEEAGVLSALETLLGSLKAPGPKELPGLSGVLPLFSGLVGYLGYDVVREVEDLGSAPPDELGLPDGVMAIFGQIAAFDHWKQRAYLIDNVIIGPEATPSELADAYKESVARLGKMAEDLARASQEIFIAPSDVLSAKPKFKRVTPRETYMRSVEAAKESILDGDAFQIVLAQRFDLDTSAEPFEIYRVLRQVNPSPYMYFIKFEQVTLVGSSPEPMVQLANGRVISRPIAGTRPRGRGVAEDHRLASELIENPKEIAEHVMLVDLARNDVGRVVEFGSEQVDEMMTLERYSHVMHMTSQVSGRLNSGLGPIDVLRATLPAGTVSGSPKVSAMKIIDSLEPTKRGPYAGIVGYLDFNGNLDTAIAIRTLVVCPDGRVSIQAGAGIVADSDPDSEDRECQYKAAALMAAVSSAEVSSRIRGSAAG